MKIIPSELTPAHLSLDSDTKDFNCDDHDLNEFLVEDVLDYQNKYLAHTTLLHYKKDLIAYYTVSCDAIRLDATEKRMFVERNAIQTF